MRRMNMVCILTEPIHFLYYADFQILLQPLGWVDLLHLHYTLLKIIGLIKLGFYNQKTMTTQAI